MPIGCKGKCSKLKASRKFSGSFYKTGAKRCQVCEIFIKWSGLWCPCCGYRLRLKARNKVRHKIKKKDD